MNNPTNVHTTSPSVRESGDRYTESGMRVPAAEVRAREVAEQAHRWLKFATERTRMRPDTLTAKALQATAFSVRHGAASLAVPSKLSGTSKHQRALWALVRDPAEPWAPLDVEATGDGLSVSYDGKPIGLVQGKHLGWVRPLLPFGLTIRLARVTGHAYEGFTLGVNAALGHVGAALDRLLDALSDSGDGVPTEAPVLSVEVRPEGDAVRTGADPDDVILYRRIDGTACASVPHAVRHSPTGIEWSYSGSGPTDLARSVLLALTDEATAERHYAQFKAEVVARVPHAGGVLRAADVRAWCAAQSEPPPAA